MTAPPAARRAPLPSPPRPSRPTTAGDVVRTVLRGLGQTLITLGLVVLLFCVYELKITNLVTDRAQSQLTEDLRRTWAEAPRVATQPGPDGKPTPAPAVTVPLGDALAVIYVPRFGKGWKPRAVVEGVSVADLKQGPGHIPATAMPGELGNMVISGHRTTYGAPFGPAGDLRPGDAIVLETRAGWFTYTVQETTIVRPTAIEVTLPVPGRPGAKPTERFLTLTTCHPKYSAQRRMIVRAVLTAASRQDAGLPPALRNA